MKKILIFFLLSNLFVSFSIALEREELTIICNGKVSYGTTKNFIDEYKVRLNTIENNSKYNKFSKNNYKDYYLKNPIQNIELIHSNVPAMRMIVVTQDLLRTDKNQNVYLKNMNEALLNIMYPKVIKKIYYAKLNFDDNILKFRYKFLFVNKGNSTIQENISSISFNTGSYKSNLTLKDTDGRFKDREFTYNYSGFCKVDNIILYLNNLQTDSKGSFSYNYLFFLLIIIGITIFVYKQGPKKKRKTK